MGETEHGLTLIRNSASLAQIQNLLSKDCNPTEKALNLSSHTNSALYLRVSRSLQVHSSADVCAQPQEFTLGLANGYQHNWEIYLERKKQGVQCRHLQELCRGAIRRVTWG